MFPSSASQSLQGTAVKPFYPALDGLRAIAFLLVFFHHYLLITPGCADTMVSHWGWAGLDMFFVLSGFLITGILFDTLPRPHFFANFYIRRSLRIFPLMFTVWGVLLLLTPILHVAWNRYVLADVFYVGNYVMPWTTHLPPHINAVELTFRARHSAEPAAIDLNHLWSLCVEEQFYLIWPPVVWAVRSRQTLQRICLFYGVFAFLLRCVLIQFFPHYATDFGYFSNTVTRADTLLAGAWLALWLRGPNATLSRIRSLRWTMILSSVGLLLLGLGWSHGISKPLNNTFGDTIGFSLIAWAAVGVLLFAIDMKTALARCLAWRPLVLIGRISYGLYVFHGFYEGWFINRLPALQRLHAVFLMPVLALLTTFVLATISFRFLESPFLRLKDRLAPRPGPADPAPEQGGDWLPPDPQPGH